MFVVQSTTVELLAWTCMLDLVLGTPFGKTFEILIPQGTDGKEKTSTASPSKPTTPSKPATPVEPAPKGMKRPAAATRASKKAPKTAAATPENTEKVETMKKPGASPAKTPKSGKANTDGEKKGAGPEAEPEALLPTSGSPSKPALKKPTSKGGKTAAANVIETKHYKGGWKVLKYKTQKGRM